jgi:putative YhdH/YhfP family quinone oxidoreductase
MTHPETYRALVVRETQAQEFIRTIENKSIHELPEGDLLIRVDYSSLNYKDALSAVGNRGVTRTYPHTPGIDAAGVVVKSDTHRFQPGDEVIVTSYDLGMNTPGGFGRYIRVPSSWAVPMPRAMTARSAMMYGTAGFTAALSIWHLIKNGIRPDDGEILVTGATGGVGSLAVAILSRLGYCVAAVNGRNDATRFLKNIGADTIVPREAAIDTGKRPLLKSLWAGVVDVVGGEVLSTAIRSAKPYATITCCGNVADGNIPMTVYPFILRGVTLVGIDSQNCPMSLRREVWEKLAKEWCIDDLQGLVNEIALEDLDGAISLMLKGKGPGRSVVTLAE